MTDAENQIQIYQLHVEFQELNGCKKRNSNTTISREKCNYLRYLIPRSICDAWRENRKCLNVKTCLSWRKGLPVLKLQEKVISFFKKNQKEKQVDVYFRDVWFVVWYFALRLRLCHSAIPWKIGVSEQFPVLVWSPPPHPHPLLEQHYNPTSLQCIAMKIRTKWLIDKIQEQKFCMIEKQVWLFGGENVTKLWARAWQWKFLRLSQTLT